MKNRIYIFLLWSTTHALGQTTHSVTVQINQPPVCTVVSLEKNTANEVFVHPNPAKDIIYLKNVPSQNEIEVHDALGRTVLLHAITDSENAVIDVQSLPRGIYYIRVRTGRKSNQSKLVLE